MSDTLNRLEAFLNTLEPNQRSQVEQVIDDLIDASFLFPTSPEPSEPAPPAETADVGGGVDKQPEENNETLEFFAHPERVNKDPIIRCHYDVLLEIFSIIAEVSRHLEYGSDALYDNHRIYDGDFDADVSEITEKVGREKLVQFLRAYGLILMCNLVLVFDEQFQGGSFGLWELNDEGDADGYPIDCLHEMYFGFADELSDQWYSSIGN